MTESQNKIQVKMLDSYILRQIIEMFLMGVCVFTSIIFASDTFITLIKQISMYGIPFKVAFMMIILNLPQVIVMTIPMGVLLATVMTLNGLSLKSEITVMRACGIGLNRIAKPIFIFAIGMSIFSFFINETIVPVMMKQSKDLALWALGQKNTVLAIWMAYTYLNPASAIAPGSYVVWQNIINSWQLWKKRRNG